MDYVSSSESEVNQVCTAEAQNYEMARKAIGEAANLPDDYIYLYELLKKLLPPYRPTSRRPIIRHI